MSDTEKEKTRFDLPEIMKYQGVALVVVLMGSSARGYPKYETSDKGAVQSKGTNDYFQVNGDQVAMETTGNVTQEELNERPPRFGFPAYTSDVQSTGNFYPGLYGPIKLDIGGLVLGTIVGLGAFFILPKLFHVVSTPYSGNYKRSEDADEANTVNDIMETISKSLSAFDFNTTACLQRTICTSLQSLSEKAENRSANGLESAVDTIAKNDAFKMLLNGTDWKKAVDVAERGESCSATFDKCPKEIDLVISTISKYLIS